MQLMQFLLLVVLSISVGSTGQRNMQPSELPYRLLHSEIWKPNDLSGTAFYAVSVTQPLDHGEIEKLICQINSKEKPSSSVPRLHISIYYDLDEYIPPIGAPSLEDKLRNHALASYIWNVMLPKAQDRLMIDRDSRGKLLTPSRGHDFDHTKACGPK
jgi:hypothetical protein